MSPDLVHPCGRPGSSTSRSARVFRRLFPVILLVQMAWSTALAADAGKALMQLPEMPLHDPWILAHRPSRTYYLYTSNVPRVSNVKGVGTMAYKSKDLRNWEPPRTVFLVPPTAFAQHGGWAPEVHEYKGRYYLFTTLHDEAKAFARPPQVPFPTYVRGTIVAVSDSPEGPFQMLDEKAPVPPADFMTLDGTLYIDEDETPWMVYAHEWLQRIDGTMEAVPLKPDLSAAAGPPIHLFKASDAPWLNPAITPDTRALTYVTDGPELFRTRDGRLLMLWSSYEKGSYVQTVARSQSGRLAGPWEQLAPLVKGDSGHGMLFVTFEDQLMMVLHRPFKNARGKLYEMADRGDHLEVVKARTDLDGDHPSLAWKAPAQGRTSFADTQEKPRQPPPPRRPTPTLPLAPRGCHRPSRERCLPRTSSRRERLAPRE